ncbi:MAG: hypothetical protein GX235_08635 [Clostridiales bacterium]|nr:hypothetical protein [Clostridiales bacterium]
MLGKLFKYDWKSFWKVPAAINIFLLIITIIGAISLISPFWELDYEIIDTLMIVAILFYYLALFAGSIAVFAYIAIRYYKNVYTDEGYLTHTLPVAPRDIILSKLFVGAIWSFITALVMGISVFIILSTAISSVELWEIIQEFKSVVIPEFEREMGMSIYVFTLLVLLYMIINTFFSILMIYSSISLGQMFTKHKVAGAVIWYIAEYVITQFGFSMIINIPLMKLFSYDSDINVSIPAGTIGSTVNMMLFSTMLITVIIGIILYFITEYMMRKKLNLD